MNLSYLQVAPQSIKMSPIETITLIIATKVSTLLDIISSQAQEGKDVTFIREELVSEFLFFFVSRWQMAL